jgi:hypothetical protein
MLSLTGVPQNAYDSLVRYKHHVAYAQGRHFLLFCWMLTAMVLETGRGTLKDMVRPIPERIRYWTLLRMVRSGQ